MPVCTFSEKNQALLQCPSQQSLFMQESESEIDWENTLMCASNVPCFKINNSNTKLHLRKEVVPPKCCVEISVNQENLAQLRQCVPSDFFLHISTYYLCSKVSGLSTTVYHTQNLEPWGSTGGPGRKHITQITFHTDLTTAFL